MNIEKMSKLIMEEEEFLDSSYCRMNTSVNNKLLHAAMITAIEVGDKQHIEEVLRNPLYREPLRGVILCMKTAFHTTTEFLEAFEG